MMAGRGALQKTDLGWIENSENHAQRTIMNVFDYQAALVDSIVSAP